MEKADTEIKTAFTDWTGGNDFGHRALIGAIVTNMGDFLVLFNNDTGNVEWMDCGYGYFDVYEENPNGIIADSVDAFFDVWCPLVHKEGDAHEHNGSFDFIACNICGFIVY